MSDKEDGEKCKQNALTGAPVKTLRVCSLVIVINGPLGSDGPSFHRAGAVGCHHGRRPRGGLGAGASGQRRSPVRCFEERKSLRFTAPGSSVFACNTKAFAAEDRYAMMGISARRECSGSRRGGIALLVFYKKKHRARIELATIRAAIERSTTELSMLHALDYVFVYIIYLLRV